MLNLNGSLTKAGTKYSTLWGEDFADADFRRKLKQWLDRGQLRHRTDHVTPLSAVKIGGAEQKLGEALAQQLRREKAIMGIFDEGCMGMFNAIIPDDLLNPTGVFKERLSQSALYYESTQVADAEAQAVRDWMEERGMTFHTGPQSCDGPDRRPDSQTVQDVHCGAADRRRLRLRPDRHSISAGSQGPDARQRPGRRHAEQHRTARR